MLTLPVFFCAAAPFFGNACRELRLRRVSMDVPVALGIGAAFAASVWATLTAGGEVYFDSVTMFVFFPVSYTHLDVYKRQVHGLDLKTKVGARVAQQREVTAASSAKAEVVTDDQMAYAQRADQHAGDELCGCLLYTSRCV